MELRYYLELARKWWWLLAAGVLAGGLAAFVAKQLETPEYEARATLLVNQVQQPGTVTYNDVLTSERLTETYRQMVESRPVLEDAQENLGLPGGIEELDRRLRTSKVRETQLLQISARAADPETAATIVNTVVDVVVQRNEQGAFGTKGSISVVERAVPPGSPVNGGIWMVTALGAFLGAMLAGGTVLLVEYLDDRVRDAERLRRLGVAVLGTVRRLKPGNTALISWEDPQGVDAEAFRVVRTAVEFSFLDRPLRVLLVTSAREGEGKTTTATNLAIVAAEAGQRVVLVDADLRRPSLHRAFGCDNRYGLTNLVLGRDVDPWSLLRATGVPNCWLLSSGPLPPNPDTVLGSSRLREGLEALARQVDLVVVDSPPVLPVADTGYLARLADGVVLVVHSERAREPQVTRTLEVLGRAGANVVGGVLNRAEARHGYGYYGSYGYGYPPEEDAPRPAVRPRAAPTGPQQADRG